MTPRRWKTFVGSGLVAALAAGLAAGAGPQEKAPEKAPVEKRLRAGQDAQGPWWMKATALGQDGRIASLKSKRWWKKAAALKTGESFVVEERGEGKDRMLVRRETFTIRAGRQVEAVVWVIDDGGNGSALTGGDKSDDCYVADYDADGTVDRMVDWIDNDADGTPDAMDIRYFTDGRLNYAWFGTDLDRDGKMWSVRGYEYQGESYFESDPYGDNIFYMNKFNPERGTWVPISECPFAFYDTDGDGESETVVRVSAVPLGYDPVKDPDYANNAFGRAWEKAVADAGIVNVRYSFDIDRGSDKQNPLHFEMGFNLVGKMPYRVPGLEHFNAERRPPQETMVVPWEDMRAVADAYPARETGFSWHENYDDTTAIGFAEHKRNDWRWEGVFWVWERRFMENTGGPCQKWNVRREWLGKPSSKRELYYSEVDRRIHLFGAEEGWCQLGNFSGLGPLGEIRMFDTDRNGYFDRWEVYLSNSSRPVRVTQVRDEKARRIDFDPDKISEFYLKDVLPLARSENDKLLAALDAVRPFDVPAGLKAALTDGPENYRRYAQDVLRELTYQAFRDYYGTQANQILLKDSEDKSGKEFLGDLRWLIKGKRNDIEATANSMTAWRLARLLDELDIAYGQGDYDRACGIIGEIAKLGMFK